MALHRAGYDVVGVEESRRAIGFLDRNYPAIEWIETDVLAFLESANAASFDAVTMFHVLEHIPHPKQTIELVDRLLRPDGILVIEVPDVDGGFARLKGERWEHYLEHHVNYFSVKSLARLLDPFGFRLRYRQPTYHFSHPQGHLFKDVVKGTLARLGLNSNIRTVWSRP